MPVTPATPAWSFRRMQPGEMNIDPIEAEFFSTEALGSLADAFIREAIQNSLDARQPGSGTRVRIAFPPPGRMLDGERKERYLAGLWPHLLADRSGLTHPPSAEEPLGFLVFEDYGTRGLQGDPSQSEDEEIAGSAGTRNDFYYFWRNVGRSRKESADLGRWGLGKTVFPASSRVNAFFALTVRRDDGRRLLMGQAVLRIHKLDGARYYPYGYFGSFAGDFALPLEDEAFLDAFCDCFGIARGREPGLSVVVPFPDSALTPEALLGSVVRHYFVPILAGDLVVEMAYDSKNETLDATSLSRLLGRAGWDKGQQLRQLAELARWGLTVGAGQRTGLATPSASAAPRWSDGGGTTTALDALKEPFDRGERIALLVPIWVKPAGGSETLASFDVYLERDEALGTGEEHFVREGITVAGVRSGIQAGVRAIVYVRDRALSALLGDSENPAHTEWQERSLRFKERYRHGASTLRYVKSAPREIVRILTRPGAGRDYRLLHHLFSREVPTEEAVRQRTRSREQRAGGEAQPEPGELESVGSDRFFQLQKLQGGFRIAGAGAGTSMPPFAGVQMAYELRRGNPFSAYQPLDFEVDRAPIEVQGQGAEVVRQLRNVIVLRIDDPDFRLAVRGFDARRDVRVKVVPLGEEFPQ
jgi:hypothetical protein